MRRNEPCFCGSGRKYKKCHPEFYHIPLSCLKNRRRMLRSTYYKSNKKQSQSVRGKTGNLREELRKSTQKAKNAMVHPKFINPL